MPDNNCVCDLFIDNAYVAPVEPRISVSSALIAVMLTIGAIVYTPITEAYIDSAQISTVMEDDVSRISFVMDSVSVSAIQEDYLIARQVRLDRFRLSAFTRFKLSDEFIDSISVSSTLDSLNSDFLTDSVRITDSVNQTAITGSVVNDRLVISDFIDRSISVVVVDSIIVSDSIITLASYQSTFIDSLVIVDLYQEQSGTKDAVTDELIIADLYKDRLVALGLAVDDLFISTVMDYNTDQSVIWTAATDSFAMSMIEAGSINSIIVINDLLTTTTPEGVAVHDRGTDCNGLIKTGLSDMGASSLKRLSGCYVGYTGQPIDLTVTSTGLGEEMSYTYPLPISNADAPRSNLIKLGRGARSRYWQFTVTGTQFELHDLELDLMETSRRR